MAMPFHVGFDSVWRTAIRPAIEEDLKMRAKRVDVTTLSGSVITSILDGICHSAVVFSDISVMRTGRWKGQRNGNVMYELGIAQAVRMPSDIVVVRSDRDLLPFDVAGVQVNTYPARNLQAARQQFASRIAAAKAESSAVATLKARQAWDRLDGECLGFMWKHRENPTFDYDIGYHPEWDAALHRLLDLNIIRCVSPRHGQFQYRWTALGRAVLSNPERE